MTYHQDLLERSNTPIKVQKSKEGGERANLFIIHSYLFASVGHAQTLDCLFECE